jgi:hypothetical protein
MNYEDWLKTLPGDLTGDPLWRVPDQRAVYLREDPSEYHTESRIIPLFEASDVLKPRQEVPFS